MTDHLLRRLLGDDDSHDPGCEVCFDAFDRYADALLAGRPAAELFPGVAAHLGNCAACREDAEGILAALRRLAEKPEDET